MRTGLFFRKALLAAGVAMICIIGTPLLMFSLVGEVDPLFSLLGGGIAVIIFYLFELDREITAHSLLIIAAVIMSGGFYYTAIAHEAGLAHEDIVYLISLITASALILSIIILEIEEKRGLIDICLKMITTAMLISIVAGSFYATCYLFWPSLL